jgi:hypothetical protein
MQSSHYLHWWQQKHHPWVNPVLLAMLTVHQLHMVPQQTPLPLLSGPGINTRNSCQSVQLTNCLALKNSNTISWRDMWQIWQRAQVATLISSFAIAGDISTALCRHQCQWLGSKQHSLLPSHNWEFVLLQQHKAGAHKQHQLIRNSDIPERAH